MLGRTVGRLQAIDDSGDSLTRGQAPYHADLREIWRHSRAINLLSGVGGIVASQRVAVRDASTPS